MGNHEESFDRARGSFTRTQFLEGKRVEARGNVKCKGWILCLLLVVAYGLPAVLDQ